MHLFLGRSGTENGRFLTTRFGKGNSEEIFHTTRYGKRNGEHYAPLLGNKEDFIWTGKYFLFSNNVNPNLNLVSYESDVSPNYMKLSEYLRNLYNFRKDIN